MFAATTTPLVLWPPQRRPLGGEQPHATMQFLQCNYTARCCKAKPHEHRVVAAAATPPPPPRCHRAAAAAALLPPPMRS